MPLLLGSVLIFAIETAQVSASNMPDICYDVVQTSSSVVKLENDAFWDKFRESVMKDKDKNKDKDNAERSPDDEEQPQNDVSENVKHQS